MNIGKIVELRAIPLKDKFEVIYGVNVRGDCTAAVDFTLLSLCGIRKQNYCIFCGRYIINKTFDGMKDIVLPVFKREAILEEDIEDYLLVIIPYSSKIETTAKKIAGRNAQEAILDMHCGDIVKVSKGANAKPETYMAVQAGNEMFLVKKNR